MLHAIFSQMESCLLRQEKWVNNLNEINPGSLHIISGKTTIIKTPIELHLVHVEAFFTDRLIVLHTSIITRNKSA
jgi:hypothetical protein